LVVQIKDNGRGFQLAEQSGHGLENMRTRLTQIGGGFKCGSAPGSGTIIEFRLPLKTTAPGKGFAG
jgi:signal transduction histidine kinase